MGTVITVGIQKGGCGKTTTTGSLLHLLSQKHKVLGIDLDSQGNLTELMTQRDIYDFHGSTVLEALQSQNASPYIQQLSENLDILTADDLLATFPRWLYTDYRGNRSLVLHEMLKPLRDKYDYILLDTPPALGDHTINALTTSDFALVMFETSKFCYSALSRFMETVEQVQKRVNPNLQVAGILTAIIDKRRTDTKALLELVSEEYEGLVFENVINRKAATGRLSINGFSNNPELTDALDQYKNVVEELMSRVKQR